MEALNSKKNFSSHLEDILQTTPSGLEKLLAAWNDLSFENKTWILVNGNYTIPEKLCRVALENENAYIRYLAAKRFNFDDEKVEHQKLKAKVASDASELVKYCLDESDWGLVHSYKTPEDFFALPHAARLAMVRSLKTGGEQIAAIFSDIEQWIKKGSVTELQAQEIISDFAGSPAFENRYSEKYDDGYDGLEEYTRRKEIETLWKLLLKIPVKISYPLINVIPSTYSPLAEILNNLPLVLLERFFWREDIRLTDFRKKIFFNPVREGMSEYEIDSLRTAAASNHINFTHAEFAGLIPMTIRDDKTGETKYSNPDDEKKAKVLSSLTHAILDPVYYLALHDLFFALPPRGLGSFDESYWSRMQLERFLEKHKEVYKEKKISRQIRELKLYMLAKKIESMPQELNFLKKMIVPGDTWATFMAFVQRWDKNQGLEKYLPEIHGFDDNKEQASC